MKTVENRDGWTDERTATAVKYWTEGHTAQQIADKLGGLTRSAVIGKLFRLGLGRGRPTTATPAQRKQRKTVTKFNFASNSTKAKAEPKPADPCVHRETIATPPETWRAFEDVDNKGCRYPHGDAPPFRFCSAKAVPGQPWCPTHFKACAPALAAKHEAMQQLSENLGELVEQRQNLRQLEGVI